jgi:cell division protease FtsH
MGRDELESKMAVLLGGRAAELLIFGIPSTGAADDLAKATEIARAIVMRYGMNEKLGLMAYEADRPLLLPGVLAPEGERRYSEDTGREIDCAVRESLRAAFDKATALLTRGRRVLERGAKSLLERETLGEAELAKLKEEFEALPGGSVIKLSSA